MNSLVGIIDYGLGNLRSIIGAVERLGGQVLLSSKGEELRDADRLILPGVGAYGDGMRRLHELGLVEILSDMVLKKEKPILGICLGYQLMAREGFEFGHHQGLGWFDAAVIPLACGGSLRLPHVGWNNLCQCGESPLFMGIHGDALFYYVHSYHVMHQVERDSVGCCEYGRRFSAVGQKNHIFGVQFHPEKSQKWGLHMLQNFLEVT